MKQYRIKSNVTSAELDGKYSLFILSIGSYINLNTTSSIIWESLKTKKNIEDLKKIFHKKYDVDDSTLEEDLLSFLAKAKELDIIDIYE